MRKFIIIISTIFLFSISAFAQDIEKKEDVQKNDSAVSVIDDSSAPVTQNSDAMGTETETKTEKRPPIPPPVPLPEKITQDIKQIKKEQQLQSLKPAVMSAAQNTVLQMSNDASISSGSPAKPADNNSLLDKTPDASATGTKPAMPPPPDAATNKALISKGAISLNFDDADIYSVIQTVFSEILKVNYIIDPKVKGRVTFRSIAPVPKENVLPVMEVILRINGVAVVEENSLYRIIPIGDLAREPSAINIGRNAEKVEVKGKALLQVVPIEHLQSSEIIKLITPFTSVNAVIVDVPKTNHIIVVDTDSNVKRLLQLINIFDSEQQKSKGPQVFVYHIQNGKAKDICSLLQQIFTGAKSINQTISSNASVSTSTPSPSSSTATSAARPQAQGTINQGKTENLVSDLVKIYADEVLNAVIILGTPEDYEVIKETIAKLDIVPRQVLIEGEIASIQLTDKMSLGLAWSLQTNMFNMNPVTISLNPSALDAAAASILNPTTNPRPSGLSLIGIDSGGSVRAVINALASKSKAKLLASPHIMVSDNKEARIQVGQQVPIPTSQFYNTSGVASTQTTIQYKDIGIILKVKPQINDSGLVALEISQEVSTYSTEKLSGQDEIILNKTEASTNLVVQDGQTIVIGGLIREDDSKSRQGIPFLYKIPLLGYLFGDTTNDASRSELVIMLTPHVIRNQQDASSITNKFTDKMTDEEMNKEIKKGIQVKTEEQKK